jgi:hypothetical protein
MLGTGDFFNQISLFEFSWLSFRVHLLCLVVGFVKSLYISGSSGGQKLFYEVCHTN